MIRMSPISILYMWLLFQFKPEETELRLQYQNGLFCASSVSSLHSKAAEPPASGAAAWNPPYTNK